MGSTGSLHLTFEPPASQEQLALLRAALKDFDYDAPVDSIEVSGTPDGDLVTSGERYVYWRKPLYMSHEVLVETLNRLGISGHGWLIEGYEAPMHPPPDADRFVFGGYNGSVVERIARGTDMREASGALYRAEEALRAAALQGDDKAVLCAADVYRRAHKKCASVRGGG